MLIIRKENYRKNDKTSTHNCVWSYLNFSKNVKKWNNKFSCSGYAFLIIIMEKWNFMSIVDFIY